jgi:hypothetical protein
MKRIAFFLLAFFMVTFTAELSAQEMTLDQIRRFRLRNSGAIVENNTLKGYYYFYMKEYNDSKTNIYTVSLYDDNLNKALSFDIKKPNTAQLLEVVYNSNTFMMIFYNKRAVEYETYDNTGKKTGTNIVEKVSIYEVERMNQSLANEEVDNITTFPIGNTGFVRSNWERKKKQGFDVEAMDNTAKRLWIYKSEEESDLLEFGDIMEVTEKFVAVSVLKKKSIMAKAFDTYFLLLDAKTGKKLMELPMRDKNDGELSLLNCFTDEEKEEITLVGEFYNPGDEVMKDKSLGLFIKIIGKTGTEVKYQKYAWAKEVLKLRKSTGDDEKDKTSLCFHRLFKTANGHLFAVAEEYRKTVSGAGVALNLLAAASGGSSDASNMQITITDMVMIEFDENLKMIAYTQIPKKKTRELLPSGYGWYSASFLANVLKSYGAFDYSFTSTDKTTDQYEVIYTDFDRDKADGSRADKMIGVISVKDGKTTTNRIPIDTEANRYSINPAKSGYLMVTEYFRKKKMLRSHLEKIEE